MVWKTVRHTALGTFTSHSTPYVFSSHFFVTQGSSLVTLEVSISRSALTRSGSRPKFPSSWVLAWSSAWSTMWKLEWTSNHGDSSGTMVADVKAYVREWPQVHPDGTTCADETGRTPVAGRWKLEWTSNHGDSGTIVADVKASQ